MLVKKLAVPLINEKILNQAEYCYVATAAISDAGFDFIRSRIPPKCKMEILTGLDVATSPGVLKRIWRNYQQRISLKIFTRNTFQANLYIFDLPFRKSVAFVGSGHFTLEGLKDNEEIFEKITDPKEIEALKSWFISYYEYAEPLTEEIILEYDLIYPSLKQREIASRQEKKDFIDLTTRGFNWDNIKFKNQYFKKEDYLVLGNAKAVQNSSEVQTERSAVQNKMNELRELIKKHAGLLKMQELNQSASIDVADYPDKKIHSLSIAFGRREAELKKYTDNVSPLDFMTVEISMHKKELIVGLTSYAGKGKLDREYFRDQMNELEYRTRFFQLLASLGAEYWIEIFGERKKTEGWLNEEVLWEFVKADDWRYYSFTIGRSFSPGDVAINSDNIAPTLEKEMSKLAPLYELMKSSSSI
jgi:hypothetical protein